ncbi:hypothetical protein BDZ89DRAFT_1037561 [Hymenopellis radicata]|nr:hypothetical protein BDZ89DRAFT_1037561 [Hymenopellis radicata]
MPKQLVTDRLGDVVGRNLFVKIKRMDKAALAWRVETRCPICCDNEFQPVFILPCPCLATLYHIECLHAWWDAQKLEPTCPTCRAAIITVVHRGWVTPNLAEKYANKKTRHLKKRLHREELQLDNKRQKLIQKIDYKDMRPLPPVIAPTPIAPPAQPNARLDPVPAELPSRGRGQASRGSARPRPQLVRRRISPPEVIDILSDDEAPSRLGRSSTLRRLMMNEDEIYYFWIETFFIARHEEVVLGVYYDRRARRHGRRRRRRVRGKAAAYKADGNGLREHDTRGKKEGCDELVNGAADEERLAYTRKHVADRRHETVVAPREKPTEKLPALPHNANAFKNAWRSRLASRTVVRPLGNNTRPAPERQKQRDIGRREEKPDRGADGGKPLNNWRPASKLPSVTLPQLASDCQFCVQCLT